MHSESPTRTPHVPARPEAASNGDALPHEPAPRGRVEHQGHDEHQIPVDLPEIGTGGVLLIAVVVLALFGGLFLLGWMPHEKAQAQARKEAAEASSAKPIVDVTKPKTTTGAVDLVLPGDVQANQSTAIYARTNGYLKPLPPGIDIGAQVKAGQLIAEISSPEVDAELEQARASLEQANVNVGRATNEYNFNKGTFERYEGLSKTGGVTQQQLDEKRAAYNIATSSLKAAQAAVLVAQAAIKRLTELQSFERVTAPFDGVITARNYDAGALISVANTSPGKELFRLDQTDTLRCFVSVPQGYSTDVKPGQAADLLVRNYPGKPFEGKVARTAGAIDQATRTLRVEVDIPNAEHKLFPGMYGQIRFKIPRERPAVVLPTSAFIFNAQGLRVAVVDDQDKVHYRTVTLGRDFGSEAEVSQGVTPDDRVVTNPGEHIAEGVDVTVNAPKGKPDANAQHAANQQPQHEQQQQQK
jgi:RND family efflux transporter MFP subunit